tara:strand:- start:3972 stop:5354 length:1383 start_codon:yes stop_codon:yes gene_type:complete
MSEFADAIEYDEESYSLFSTLKSKHVSALHSVLCGCKEFSREPRDSVFFHLHHMNGTRLKTALLDINEHANQYGVDESGKPNISNGIVDYISRYDEQTGLCLPPTHQNYYIEQVRSPRRKSHMNAHDMNNGCPHLYVESEGTNCCYYPKNARGKELWKTVQKKLKNKEIEFLLKDLEAEYPGNIGSLVPESLSKKEEINTLIKEVKRITTDMTNHSVKNTTSKNTTKKDDSYSGIFATLNGHNDAKVRSDLNDNDFIQKIILKTTNTIENWMHNKLGLLAEDEEIPESHDYFSLRSILKKSGKMFATTMQKVLMIIFVLLRSPRLSLIMSEIIIEVRRQYCINQELKRLSKSKNTQSFLAYIGSDYFGQAIFNTMRPLQLVFAGMVSVIPFAHFESVIGIVLRIFSESLTNSLKGIILAQVKSRGSHNFQQFLFASCDQYLPMSAEEDHSDGSVQIPFPD